jgi:hypothetical protein
MGSLTKVIKIFLIYQLCVFVGGRPAKARVENTGEGGTKACGEQHLQRRKMHVWRTPAKAERHVWRTPAKAEKAVKAILKVVTIKNRD